MKPAANHLIAEFDNCKEELLSDRVQIEGILKCGIVEAGFGLLSVHCHEYAPIGITAVAIISESHVVIHTYPEAAHISVDIFSCAPDPRKSLFLLDFLRQEFQPCNVRIAEVQRGSTLEIVRPNRIALLSTDGIEISMQISERLYEGRTKYQNIKVLRTDHFGKMLVLDDELQIAQSDAHIYNQALVSPLLEQGECLGHVLILGGGDGGAARELMCGNPKKATLVDIDPEVTAVCQEYLPEVCEGVFANPKLEVVSEDVHGFLEKEQAFDAVIYDLTMHPEAFINIARRDYLKSLFKKIKESMQIGSMLSVQCGSEFDKTTLDLLRSILCEEFGEVSFFETYVPSFFGKWVFASAKRLN